MGCTDPQPAAPPHFRCDNIVGSTQRLCRGLAELEAATCEELLSEDFLQRLVERVGLKKDRRGELLYGAESVHMITDEGASKGGRGWGGLWQDPRQFASMLVHLGRHVKVRSYLEIGPHTAWTCCILSAYLRRSGGAGEGRGGVRFSGVAVDISKAAVTADTFGLLRRLNVSFHHRPYLRRLYLDGKDTRDPTPLKRPESPRFDLCFVDGDHKYGGVKADYAQLGPWCKWMLFHDVSDVSTLRAGPNYDGGTVAFWQDLTAHVEPQRVSEFVSHASAIPMFGLGLLAPNANGTAEAEAPVATWPKWRAAGLPALRSRLCAGGADGRPAASAVAGSICTRYPTVDALAAVLKTVVQG